MIAAFILFLILIFVLYKIGSTTLVKIKSTVDGRSYKVQDLDDKQRAANMLARLRQNIFSLTTYLTNNIDKYKEYKPYIEQLSTNIQDVYIRENTSNSYYTSYSVNKGQQIVFCLRSKRYPNMMHDMNMLMYVTLHELGHVATPEFGHTPLFKKNFAMLTRAAIDMGIYHPIDFDDEPREYCGLMINDSIVDA